MEANSTYTSTWLQVFGWNKADVEGKNISMLMPPPYSQMHNGILRAYNETGTSNIINRTRELQGLHMDRYSFPIKLAVTKVAQTGKLFCSGINCVLYDPTPPGSPALHAYYR